MLRLRCLIAAVVILASQTAQAQPATLTLTCKGTTIDNSDPVTHTYQGFDGYLVGDLRAAWRVSDHVTAAVGIDNIGNHDYFLFHPFPQRTVVAELKWTL